MLQVALLCRVAPVAMHIHVPRDVVKDFFVRCASLHEGQHILFMTREHGHFTSFLSLAIIDMHKEGPIVSRLHITRLQIAEF
jgi:hypothetical protein